MNQATEIKSVVQKINVSNTYLDIMTFLDRYKSPSTRKNYERHIYEFFQFMNGKKLNELNKDDIEYIYLADSNKEKFMMKHIDQYKTHLKNKHPKSESTILAKLSAVRSLYKYLSVNGYDVNHMIFDLKFLEAKPDSYDVIPPYLVMPFSEKAKEYSHAGNELSVFILVAAQTSFRISALLKLELNDIRYDKNSGYYEVKVIDKGDIELKSPIDNETYKRIVELNNHDLIFPTLKLWWVNNTIKKIASEFSELDDKHIVSHSLRKSAPTFAWETTKDIKKVMEQSNHKSVEVAMKTYVQQSDDYDNRAGIRMMKKVDENILDLLTKEEIINLLKESNPSAYHTLVLEVDQMLNKKQERK